MKTNELLIRLLLATLAGLLIGIERQTRSKSAGLRTHAIVSLGAALMMIVSQYGFAAVLGNANVNLDPSRIAAQIVSGISFLGAGMIIVRSPDFNVIGGLTTAAGIWTTAGVGMAIGAGLYEVGFAATFIIVVLQLAFHYFNDFNLRQSFSIRVYLTTIDDVKKLRDYLTSENISSKVSRLKKSETGLTIDLTVTTPRNFSLEDIGQIMAATDIDSSWELGL